MAEMGTLLYKGFSCQTCFFP